QCLLYLYTLKLWYPKKIIPAGKPRVGALTEYFTFKRKCRLIYSSPQICSLI
ncbi:hypothetical protein FIBSPDRAFT_766441, partial [Athelia psychrophila]